MENHARPCSINGGKRKTSAALVTAPGRSSDSAAAAAAGSRRSSLFITGSEASAADIAEIISLIETYDIPAIFTEVNGSDATAQAIARETGVAVCQLTTIMSGDGVGIQPYVDAMNANYNAILAALGG